MTTYPIIRLEAPGVETLVLDPAAGIYGQTLDLGDAITRAVSDDIPDADGTDDTTVYFGARNITLQVILLPDSGLWALRQHLRAFTSPRLRPYMYVQQSADAPEQQIQLRRSQYTDVIGDGPRMATQADPEAAIVTIQWVAPLGILESAVQHSQDVFAVATGAAVGRAYSLAFSRVYPASPVLGSATVVNAGNTDAYPLIRIYGPVTEPVLDNNTQGKSLAFTGLTLVAGEYLEIDTRAKTILLNSDPTNSRYDKLAFPTSQWWTLSPGNNIVRFHPTTFTDGVTLANFTWRDAFA